MQKDCAKTQDDIEKELELIKVELKRRIAAKKVKIKNLEA